MSNALLPTMSSSRFHYGNKEVQLRNFRACMRMEEDLLSKFPGNGLFMESVILNNETQTDKFIPQGSLYGTSMKDNSQRSMLPSKRPLESLYDGVMQVGGNGRKRPFEAIHNKITNLEQKWHEATTDTLHKIPKNKWHVPVRRNQKLNDKITTLQKLVSPFGKTDTASVLQEASLYIKLLQEQIRNLFQMLSFSYSNTIEVHHHKRGCGEKEVDLRSKGLCLVPISMVQKVTMEDQSHCDAVSRRFNYELPNSVSNLI